MFRGRHLFFLTLLMASAAYSQGLMPGQQMYYQPQQSSGYGMYGAQQTCGSAPRSIPKGIKNLERDGAKAERDLAKKERDLTKAQGELERLEAKRKTTDDSLDHYGNDDYKRDIKIYRQTYISDGCRASNGKVQAPHGTKRSDLYYDSLQVCDNGDCGSGSDRCRPTEGSWCTEEKDCDKKSPNGQEVCHCEYQENFACNVSGVRADARSKCSSALKDLSKLDKDIRKKKEEVDRLASAKAEAEEKLSGIRSEYDAKVEAFEYGEDYGTEGTTCFSCMQRGGGGGDRYAETGGANGFSLAQTGIAAGIQVLGMTLDWKNRGRMMDVYGDLGWPPPANAFAPFVVGNYGYPFAQGGFYGGVMGGFGNGGFGCGGSVGGGGYGAGPYGMYSPYGMMNPYGQAGFGGQAGMWGNPYQQGGMGPYGPYMPGMYPGGMQAGPWGMNAGINAGFNLGLNGQFGMNGMMPGYGMNGMMPGYGMNGMMPGYGMNGMMPGYGMNGMMPGYGMNGMMPGYGMNGMMPGFGGQFGAGFGAGFGMPGYGMPGYGMPGYGMPGYGMPGYGMPGYGMPGYGMPGGTGGVDYSTYMRQAYSRYMDNYTSTLREYQNLSFDMQSMYSRLQMLQMQLSNPYASAGFGGNVLPLTPTLTPTPTPTPTTPGR